MSVAGKISKLQVREEGGTTWISVTGRTDATLNLNEAEIDASHMDGDGWAEFLQGRKDASIDFTVRYNEDDAGQALLINNYFDDILVIYHGPVTGGPFQVGEIITGQTSLATATVVEVGDRRLIVSNISGIFQPNETISGETSLATATTETGVVQESADKLLEVRFYLEPGAVGSPKLAFEAKGFVISLSPAPTDEAPTDMSGTIRITGAITKTTQEGS